MFYCLYYVKYISTDMLQEQVLEDRDLDLNEEEYIRMEDNKEDHCRYVDEYGEDKKNIHALSWYV